MEIDKRGWRAVGKSVRGASHLRNGLPNQDRIRWLPDSGQGVPLAIAISDGHGSQKYIRSHIGAECAVSSALTIFQDLITGLHDETNLSTIKRTAEERIPNELTRRWREAVIAHFKHNPLSDDERLILEKSKAFPPQDSAQDYVFAYGATIVATLITETFILYLQLGDGDILAVSEAGDVSRPFTKDARLMANETTSLCQENAWRDVQVKFQAMSAPPALILLATDGYANSFRDEESFLKVGKDLFDMIPADGLQSIDENMEDWLNEASRAGSGDDVTVGIICSSAYISRNQDPGIPFVPYHAPDLL